MRILIAALSLLLTTSTLAATSLEIWFEHPRSADFVFGEVEVEVEVAATADDSDIVVEVFVDGRRVGELASPPYRLKVDVGYDNVEHEFKAIVRTGSGETETAIVITPKLQVDEVVEVELQQLYVTVTEGDDRVLDLSREDFRISDEGKKQEIVTFERGDIPLTATLLLDCSLSMKGERLEAALHGAGVFVDGMNELDKGMVMLFSDRLLRATEFSDDPEDLATALVNVQAAGGTSVNDHLFMALNRLEKEQGRRVVVLFSDGSDVHSVLPMVEVLQKARSSQALIYWIHLRESDESDHEVPRYTSSWRDLEANQVEFKKLRAAVYESGGRIIVVRNASRLEEAFSAVIQELRDQYVLGYYPSIDRGDGSWHEVKVRVGRPNLTVRTREGYIDY